MTGVVALNASAEKAARTLPGVPLLLFLLADTAAAAAFLIQAKESPTAALIGVGLALLAVFVGTGFYAVQPNEAFAVLLFGDYRGTERRAGLRWVLPWYSRKKVSLRVRNLTSDKLKVNDKRGNPIEIAANVVWRVENTAQALFDVDDYATFVSIQIDTGLRDIASHYAYDHGEEHEPTLRAEAEIIAERLREELNSRVKVAGLSVDEARLAHLAYAPEIAGVMLKRQQAEAVLSARRLIVEGAVGMVETALQHLGERDVVQLDEERKAAMVSNLLVVLCADREVQPVVNAGTLYG